MGIDYDPCSTDGCEFTVCDHSEESFYCKCGTKFCTRACGVMVLIDNDYEQSSCKYCRLEIAKNDELLKYVLESFGIERDFIEKEFLLKKKGPNGQKENRRR